MTLLKVRLSAITSSDRRMDIIDTNHILDTPINKYITKCDACKFPDIDKTPEPYYLAKNRVFSGVEIVEADLGNLFISERVRQILEILFPGICNYERTYIQNSKIATSWWLAIPNYTLVSGEVNDNIPRCEKCGQPLHAHPGSQYKFWAHDFESEYDIMKSVNWHSIDENDWKKSWIGRDVFLSVRLISLLKKVSAKGIYQQEASKYPILTKDEKSWVEGALKKLGSLSKNNSRKEINENDRNSLMNFFEVVSLDKDIITSFEQKFKCKSSGLSKILCNVPQTIAIITGEEYYFKIETVKNWELLQGSKKLISFAFDDFGNSLQFDPKSELCPIYYFDHETGNYELMHTSILDILSYSRKSM